MTTAQREAIKEAIRRQTLANTKSKQAALQSMIRNGFYKEDGKLAPEYGGKVTFSARKKANTAA